MEFTVNKTFDKLKYDLVRDGLISLEDIEKAKEISDTQNVNIRQVLINSNLITEEVLMKFLESKLHIPYVNLDDYSPDKKCLKFINYKEALRYKILPLFKIEDTLTVAMADPLDLFAIENLMEDAGLNIDPVISSEKNILSKIEEYYEETDKNIGEIRFDEEAKNYSWENELHKDDLSEEHIQNLIRAILKQAIINDVHELFFEYENENLKVKFKKNYDEIQDKGAIPALLTSAFISRLKVLSELDPLVSLVPQLGKLNFKVENMGENIELIASVCSFPTVNQERISLKIYKPPKKLEEILDTEKINKIQKAINEAGIILVCGASLSGKTHLIYSILTKFACSNKVTMTLESIVKYNLKDVLQSEFGENVAFNLDKAMRFIEFQSPDVIYFEGITTSEGLDYFTSLVSKNKTLITELFAKNMESLRERLSRENFSRFLNEVSCLIFIHNPNDIEVFDKNELEKYL